MLRPFTILRTHLFCRYTSDQAAVTESPFGSYGMIVVTANAVSIGVTAMPDPSGISGEPDAGWFVWQAMSTEFVFSSAVGIDANAGSSYEIDSKAMRKVGPNDDVATIFSQENAVGSQLKDNGRMLIQLH